MYASKIVNVREIYLLNIGDSFDGNSRRKENNTNYVRSGIESTTLTCMHGIRHHRAIQNCDGQIDCPHPSHLKYPESQKFEKSVSHTVKSIIFVCHYDSKQQES